MKKLLKFKFNKTEKFAKFDYKDALNFRSKLTSEEQEVMDVAHDFF